MDAAFMVTFGALHEKLPLFTRLPVKENPASFIKLYVGSCRVCLPAYFTELYQVIMAGFDLS